MATIQSWSMELPEAGRMLMKTIGPNKKNYYEVRGTSRQCFMKHATRMGLEEKINNNVEIGQKY